MTCIVGLKTPDGIWIGGDASAVGATYCIRIVDPKVFKRDEFTIGYAGSFRFGDLLRHYWEPPKHDPKIDVASFMHGPFIDSIIGMAEGNGMLKNESGHETLADNAEFIVAYRDTLWVIDNDLGIVQPLHGYCSAGIGENFALGSLCSTSELDLPGPLRVESALHAASELSHGVKGPFTIIKHDPVAPKKRGRIL